ncbi:hypothetical protein LRN67_16820, partial [Escherichia coli]|uniref:hypothetical protein n=1 Tax=Escherichia coli TaxID=562 RepID=UPI001F42C48B
MDTPRPQLLDFQFHQNNDSFTLHFQQRLILTHSKDKEVAIKWSAAPDMTPQTV